MSGRGNVATLLVLQLQPIAVDTNSPDREGMLVIANGLLVAVLVRLAEPEHDNVGSWFLEAGFGRLQGQRVPTFPTLEDACRWLRRRLKPL
ncbi:hypothetical protein MKK88_10075 [Methylobacterium sp. E-005]|jgi:hypothetical protein|uniref:hypothetical protein n=1 Tax=Methylobacterium sp. E-005 TaxID=2836549 RepID=UPI001FBA63B9|nr:hypothetical protein [Methylobacterium sp. E-005]MCJ2086338.1 hypothetical protein [Methylobacterium sp. E-005]